MINLTLAVNEKVLVTVHPRNFAGIASQVKDVTWVVLSGSSTVTPSADGMSAVIVAAQSKGVSVILVGANTNLSSSVNTGSVDSGSVNTGSVDTGSAYTSSVDTSSVDTAWDYTQHSKKSNKKHDKRASIIPAPTTLWWNNAGWSQHDEETYRIHSSAASNKLSLDKMENSDGIIYNHITVNVVEKRVNKTHGQSTDLGLTAGSPEPTS
jgi:hypothetical protein